MTIAERVTVRFCRASAKNESSPRKYHDPRLRRRGPSRREINRFPDNYQPRNTDRLAPITATEVTPFWHDFHDLAPPSFVFPSSIRARLFIPFLLSAAILDYPPARRFLRRNEPRRREKDSRWRTEISPRQVAHTCADERQLAARVAPYARNSSASLARCFPSRFCLTSGGEDGDGEQQIRPRDIRGSYGTPVSLRTNRILRATTTYEAGSMCLIRAN